MKMKKFSNIQENLMKELLEDFSSAHRDHTSISGSTPQTVMEHLCSVGSLDVEKGIIMCGGVEAHYRTVLAQYCKDAKNFLPTLRETLESIADRKKKGETHADASSSPWLQSFVIKVHALKSTSASIGAEALSKDAMLLEKAGREGDLELIETHLEAFIQRFSEMVIRINRILTGRGSKPRDAASPLSGILGGSTGI